MLLKRGTWMKRYDLVIIGAGAAGLVAASGAAGLGASVALIEKAQFGGDCLWTGCVPTKSLIQSAKIVQHAQQAKEFGIQVTGRPHFAKVRDRIHKAIATIQIHDDPKRFQEMGIDVYHGYGSFANPHEIRIDDEQIIYGKRIVIATGSSPLIPFINGLYDAGFVTNESVLQMEQLPSSLIIVGGGPMGLEYAQSFARFGTKVTIVERAPDILIREDAELIPYVKQVLEQEGISLMTGANIVKAEKADKQKKIFVEKNGKLLEFKAEEILIACGRKPNTDRLRLENAEVKTDRGYVLVNARLQTNIPHIYAAGDVIGSYSFTHTASYEGKIIVSNAVVGLKRKVNYHHLPWVVFTDPEVFHLGLTEQEARQKHGKIRVYRTKLEQADRFIADQKTEGLIKIITDMKGTIVGAHAVGAGAGDFMQEIVFAKRFGHKIGSLSHVIHPYPARTGAVQRTADLYWRDKLFKGFTSKLIKTYIHWFR
jgi:pyruvate/2-oxoglutarate dehydrogenase complex dihydrolipoamide dehydrogenase (E3) component